MNQPGHCRAFRTRRIASLAPWSRTANPSWQAGAHRPNLGSLGQELLTHLMDEKTPARKRPWVPVEVKKKNERGKGGGGGGGWGGVGNVFFFCVCFFVVYCRLDEKLVGLGFLCVGF